jgi:hypothetical protein
MYMKSRHRIRSFSAWAPICDLVAWYGECLARKNKYIPEIIQCIGAGDMFDEEKAKERSPFYWQTPHKQRRKSQLQIYAGIHDGYNGPVPITHSIRFYNKILADASEKRQDRYVSDADASLLSKSQSYPAQSLRQPIDNRVIHYQKAAGNISLVIFEGNHEILRNVALERLENQP